jgi:hypothetical protein
MQKSSKGIRTEGGAAAQGLAAQLAVKKQPRQAQGHCARAGLKPWARSSEKRPPGSPIWGE